MRLLQRNARSRRATAAASCSRSTGSPAGTSGGRPVDWFYYVNGVEARTGAAAVEAARRRPRLVGPPRLDGDADVPAVVGSFPEPFVHGLGGKRLPVRVECAGRRAAPRARPSSSGSRRSACPSPRGGLRGARVEETLRVLVGPWSAIARDPAVGADRARARRPAASTRAPRATARSLAPSTPAAAPVARRSAPATGLIAADAPGGDREPTWVVTGTDAAGVAAAARAFDQRALRQSLRGRRDAPRPAAARCRSAGRDLPAPGQPAARRPRGGGRARTASRSRRCALIFEHPLVLAARGRRRARRRGGRRRRAQVARSARYTLPLALLVAVVNALVVRDGLTVIARLGEVPRSGQVDITLEALVYGALLGARVVVVVLCCALFAAAVDPDEVLRAVPPHVAALGADRRAGDAAGPGAGRRRAAHGRRAALPAGEPAPRRLARRARRRGRRAGPRGRRRRDARGPRLRRGRRRAAARATPWSRHDVAFARRRDGHRRAHRRRRPAAGVAELRAYPRLHAGASGRPEAALARLALVAVALRAVRRPPGDRAMSARRPGPRHLHLSGRRGARAARRDVTVEPGEFVVLAGLSAGGKSTLLRAACGLVPHFHGGTFAGRAVVGGLDTRDHGPGDLAAVAGTLFQDPETQVVLGTVRHELAFPLENRGASARPLWRAGSRRSRSRWASRRCWTARPASSAAASCSASRSAPRSPARPPLVLLDEPTSQLDPVAGDELVWLLRRLNEEWGTAVVLAEHRLERCLAARRPRRRRRRRRDRLRRAAARVPAMGGRARARAADAGRAAVLACRAAPAAGGRQGGARHAALARAARRAAGGRAPAAAPPTRAPPRPIRRSARRGASGASCPAGAPCCAASTSRSRPASASC